MYAAEVGGNSGIIGFSEEVVKPWKARGEDIGLKPEDFSGSFSPGLKPGATEDNVRG
jgi:hypothetical protein